MVKVLRKKRLATLKNKRLVNYLPYALGEIILVVIGILIALQINNWNEVYKEEKKVVGLLEDVLGELESNAEATKGLVRFYDVKDSIHYLIMNDRLKESDYRNSNLDKLHQQTIYYSKLNLETNAYNNLVANLDIVPDKYKLALKNLSILNNVIKVTLDDYNKKMEAFVENILSFRASNFDWYNKSRSDKDYIQYLLTDYRYKNNVKRFYNAGLENHLKSALNYKQFAEPLYFQIASMLDKKNPSPKFLLKKELIRNLIGTYHLKSMPKLKLNVEEKENRLFYSTNEDPTKIEIFPYAKNKLVTKDLKFVTVINKDNKLVFVDNSGLVLIKEPSEN